MRDTVYFTLPFIACNAFMVMRSYTGGTRKEAQTTVRNTIEQMISESIQKNKKGILLMVLSSIVVCLGQLLWKLGANGDILILAEGFALYGIGALIMIVAYRFGSLSVLQPILSLNYVISLLVGYFFLNESISLYNILGVIIIIGGVYLIATGD